MAFRFRVRFIEPDKGIPRIRLSDKVHAFAHDKVRVPQKIETTTNAM